ncbi:MAG: carbon storage regulator CsrA [Dethiobacteria bacterium]|jgi:carbon storage regulator
MLILTRRRGESIVIGTKIRVKVLEIDGNTISIGVEAPKTTPVHREEVYRAIEEENKRAARGASAVAAKLQQFQENC